MKNVWLILIFIIISCSSESDNFVQYEKNGDFSTTTASVKIYNINGVEHPPYILQGVRTLVDYVVTSNGKYGEEPEEEIKKSFLTIKKMEVCFNSYCISENSIDFDTLGYNDEISQYFTIDYKKLTDLPDGAYTLRMVIQASEEFDNTTTTKMFYTTFGTVKLIKPYYPANHNNVGFADRGSLDFHCYNSCQLPYGNWLNTPSKDCVVCHNRRPWIDNGAMHPIN